MIRPMRRLLRWLNVLAWTGIGVWFAGLLWFVHSGMSPLGDQATQTDAIVVLTGGRMRLETGIDLFGAGKAQKLFISGVNHHVDREALTRVFEPVASRAACCIVLGHDADNTTGNARETAQWMRQERFASLRLVTSWYHMPRSLLEFRRAMPGIRIVPTPVFAHGEDSDGRGGAWLGAMALTVSEYNKYLAVRLRIAMEPVWPGLAPEGAPAPSEATAAAAMRRQ